mmetsp:Transcript_61165/g.131539  ORF Transcript_61165/g.131539 Transcript_61165/m.131539 type:complete len:127 (+) Transcript_61165:95-475(+)
MLEMSTIHKNLAPKQCFHVHHSLRRFLKRLTVAAVSAAAKMSTRMVPPRNQLCNIITTLSWAPAGSSKANGAKPLKVATASRASMAGAPSVLPQLEINFESAPSTAEWEPQDRRTRQQIRRQRMNN